MANTQRDPTQEAFWREVILRQAGSGRTVRDLFGTASAQRAFIL